MTDASTAIELAPWVALVQPYLIAAVTAAVPVLLGIAVNKFTQWTNIKIDNETRDRFTKAAQTEAGAIFAKGGAEIATKSIDVKSAEVASAANAIAQNLPKLVAATGMTTERLSTIVAGEVGKPRLPLRRQTIECDSRAGVG